MALEDTNGMGGLSNPDAASPDAAAPAAPAAAPTPDAAPVLSGDSQQPTQQQTASPVQGDLQQPQDQAAPPPSGITPAGENFQGKKPNFFKSYGQAFAGAILSGLAGNEKTSYRVEDNPDSPDYGKTITQKTPMGRADKLRAIAQNALIGLISAENTPNQPGGELSAGIAAGAAGVMQKQAIDDAQKRKQATEDFQQQQQADASRALKWRNTVTAVNEWATMKANLQKLDPLYERNKSIYTAATDPTYGIPGTKVVTDTQLQTLAQSDHDWGSKWYPLVIGSSVTGTNAKTGAPQTEGEIALIPQGAPGQFKIPAALASDIQKYGKKNITGYAAFKEGALIPADKLPVLLAGVAAGKAAATEADKKPDLVIPTGKENAGKNLMRQNTVTGEMEPASDVEQTAHDDALQKIALSKSEVEKNQAAAEKDRKLASAAGEALVVGVDPTDGLRKVVSGKDAVERGFTSIETKITPTLVDGYSRDHGTMNDIQAKMNLVLPTLGALNQSTVQTGIISDALKDTEATVIGDVVEKNLKKNGTPATRQFILAILGLREAIFGMQRLQTGSARPNGPQIQALLKTLPGASTPDDKFGLQQLQRVELDLNRRRVTIPIPPGLQVEPVPPILSGTSTNPNAPPASALKEGMDTTFKNGQTWTLKNGVPTQVAGAK